MPQLAERSLQTPEDMGSNPAISIIYCEFISANCFEKMKNKEKRDWEGTFKKNNKIVSKKAETKPHLPLTLL